MRFNLTKNTFQHFVLESKLPAIVEFTASWCGSTSIIRPIMKKLNFTYKGKINFYRINIETNRTIANQYGINSIPVLLIFKNGSVENVINGTFTADELEENISVILKK